MKAAAKTAVLAIIMALFANQNSADEPAPKKPVRKPVKLPGMVIDFQKRCVDLEATICLDRGYLELIACTKGSKEHESIVSIKARPMHVHTALLFLGATNGNPAMRKSVDEEKMRWVNHPPRGDPINVYLVVKNSKGESVERPVSDFVTRSKERTGEIADDAERGPKEGADKDNKFPHTFLFAGSHLRDNGKGPRQYLADLSGHVISVATFGDELLCLPDVQSHANGALMWQVDSTHLPKVGTMVTLRLRPKKDERTGAKK
ncbi:MAG TPA: hypothetical protein EYQ75_17245 [Planctomycetaceae bacterium]|nr:hypothetical protein [Planctomycetaceae bacterium]